MEIGTEISHKIRSAIKAKLVELGAYVDEELPDYIMVMVANKKSPKQMTDDLELFLGSKTEVFTTWLHELLKKLQSIGGDPKTDIKPEGQQMDSSSSHKRSKHEGKDKKTKEKKGKCEKSTDHGIVINVKNEPGEISDSEDILTIEEKDDVTVEVDDTPIRQTADESVVQTYDVPVLQISQTADESLKKTLEPIEITPEHVVDDVEPELLVRADTDEFTEELHIEEEKNAVVKAEIQSTSSSSKSCLSRTKCESSRTAKIKKTTLISTREIIDSKCEKRSYITSRLGVKLDTRPQAVASPIKQPTSGQIAISSKRQGPTSVVGNVIDNNDDEEEYDPLNPAVGSVASVVKVTSRKSSVPRLLQANKSLLLRAVTEAEKSITVKRAVSKPFKAATSQMVVRPLRRDEPVVKQPKLQLTTKSRQQDIYRSMKYTIDNENDQPKYVIRKEEVFQPGFITKPIDNRVVEYIPQTITIKEEAVDSSEDDVIEVIPLAEPPQAPILLEDIDEEFEAEVPPTSLNQDKRTFNPKFVVTLDGVDPDAFTGDTRNESDIAMSNIVQSEITANKVNPPKVKPFNINLKDSDDEGDGDCDVEMTPLKQAKAAERCKFWPACVNGNSCQYHHPTLPCKTFPHCKFADKCLYIHPNCKYDAKCSRLDCPYTHATRRSTGPPVVPQVVAIPHHQVLVAAPSTFPPESSTTKQCIYYPNCSNMTCSFYHPTPCRFGLACRNKFCTYYHPSLPTKDKLKWSSQKRISTTAEVKQDVFG
ncbi:zinc finger CCCH domain-containing protein 14 isoform X2 [Patella vulgata]|uniref:zinc finger CCCH domain-containing protein 14 isoform X2 n=1 Tax=Patella vulgata TaxID=6465 RepID=UPI00218049FE|nr:zinc finger CCCH domain-containing protein 14 isoform X2 [Patella vulgata]